MAIESDFLPHVRPYVTAAPETIIISHIRMAIAEFCEATRWWRHVVLMEDLEPAASIEPTLPSNTEMFEIERAWFNDVELTQEQFKNFSALDLAIEGSPFWITQENPDTVILVPRGTGTLRMSVFLKPSISLLLSAGPTYPDVLVNQHARTISYGAIGHIKALPGESWSDMQGAGAYLSLFQSGKDREAWKGARGQQRAQNRARPSFF